MCRNSHNPQRRPIHKIGHATTPEEFKAEFHSEYATLEKLIKAIDIKIN